VPIWARQPYKSIFFLFAWDARFVADLGMEEHAWAWSTAWGSGGAARSDLHATIPLRLRDALLTSSAEVRRVGDCAIVGDEGDMGLDKYQSIAYIIGRWFEQCFIL
jgi:hypothetical protein